MNIVIIDGHPDPAPERLCHALCEAYYGGGGFPKGKLAGRSARIVVTMGMPALAYRWWFGAHSLKNLERNILKFCGIKPIRSTLYGMVDQASDGKRQKWLTEMRELGQRAR